MVLHWDIATCHPVSQFGAGSAPGEAQHHQQQRLMILLYLQNTSAGYLLPVLVDYHLALLLIVKAAKLVKAVGPVVEQVRPALPAQIGLRVVRSWRDRAAAPQ